MARSALAGHFAVNAVGDATHRLQVVSGATIVIKQRSDLSVVQVWDAEVGGASAASTTSDSRGLPIGYVDRPGEYRAEISKPGEIDDLVYEFDVEYATADVQLKAERSQPNGYASLDGAGHVPAAQLPVSAMEFKGTWDASTNTPALADGVGNTGDTYRVSVAGSRNLGSGVQNFQVSDDLIYDGAVWHRVSGGSGTDPTAVHTGDAAGGVLGGTYPNPAFAVDMATQAELDANPLATHLSGTLAARPAAAAGNAGWFYFATDDAGGTLYRSTGAAWVKIAASVLAGGGASLGAAKTTTTSQTTTTVYPTFTDVTGSSITITHGVRPILLTFTAMQLRSNTINMVQFAAIREGATVLGVAGTSNVATVNRGSNVIVRALIDVPDTGNVHTYKASFATGAAATAEIIADPTYPTLLMAQEV